MLTSVTLKPELRSNYVEGTPITTKNLRNQKPQAQAQLKSQSKQTNQHDIELIKSENEIEFKNDMLSNKSKIPKFSNVEMPKAIRMTFLT